MTQRSHFRAQSSDECQTSPFFYLRWIEHLSAESPSSLSSLELFIFLHSSEKQTSASVFPVRFSLLSVSSKQTTPPPPGPDPPSPARPDLVKSCLFGCLEVGSVSCLIQLRKYLFTSFSSLPGPSLAALSASHSEALDVPVTLTRRVSPAGAEVFL